MKESIPSLKGELMKGNDKADKDLINNLKYLWMN